MRAALIFVMIVISMARPAGAQEATPTPAPVSPADLFAPPAATVEPEATEELRLAVQAAEGQELDPPFVIKLPDDWQAFNRTIAIQDIMTIDVIPYTLYTGPVSGGQGFIIALWGFQTVGTQNPATQEVILDPYLDALRLLRLAVIGSDCVPGTDVEREFTIGDLTVTGANFSAYRCEETTDTRGWFFGLTQDGLSFAFYMYAEPIEAMDGDAPFELQAILDTVEFRVDQFIESIEPVPTLTPLPSATPR
jgi:hypothetical protein